MSIHDLAREHRLDIPGYDLIHYRRMAFPFWHANLKVLVLREVPFTIVEEFVVKMVDTGVTMLDDIASTLGLDTDVVTEAAASLFQKDLIKVDQLRRVTLTKKGLKTLPGLRARSPEIAEVSVLIDGLTSAISTASRLIAPGKIKRLGLPAVNTLVDRPTEQTIPFKLLQEYVSDESNRGMPKGDLVDILKVEKAWTEYKPMSLLIFRNANSDAYRFNVYDKEHLVEEYEAALLELENERGVPVIPTEPPPQPDELPIQIVDLSPETVEEADRNRDVIRSAEARIKAVGPENMEPSMLGEIQATIEHAEHKMRTLDTWEHRPLLLKALSRARQRVIVVSPWLHPEAMDDELFGLLEDALRRKVYITIVHGLGAPKEAETTVLTRIHEIKRKSYGSRLQMKRLGNTHQKILICDREYVVVGSFNWLSFRGDKNRSLRLETSIYTEDPRTIDERIERVEALIAMRDTVPDKAQSVVEANEEEPVVN